MAQLKIGCAGWEYKDWRGFFYPKNLEPSQYLEFYSKYFDFTEINSTFYNVPSQKIIIGWKSRVPQNFRYSIKVWKAITHESQTDNLEINIDHFFINFTPLSKMISCFLFQFPPWFKYTEKNLSTLKEILYLSPERYYYVVELRDNSWFTEKILNALLDIKKLNLVTSYLENIIPIFPSFRDFYYVRLIGDRRITKFNRVQRDKTYEIEQLWDKIENLIIKNNRIKEIFIIVNNHFTGFSPETVNILKEKWKIPYIPFNSQKNILEFL